MNIQEEWELHKPKKKTWGRFLRVIFGRTTFVITALLIQLVILCLSFQWLREHVFYLYGGFVGLSAVVVIYIINKNQNPSYQLSWIIPVLVFPVFGALFYLFVDPKYALAYWISGLPWDVVHCIGNFVLMLILGKPLYKLLKMLNQKVYPSTE